MPREVKLDKLSRKFSALTKSKDSIQSLSLWIICHNTCRDEITKEWLKAVEQADMQHRLTLFYLANDVLQNCKRRGAAEFRTAFAQVLGDALVFARDENIKDEVHRLIHIWGERNVFNPALLKLFQEKVEADGITKKDGSDSSNAIDGKMLENFDPRSLTTLLKDPPRKKSEEKFSDAEILSDHEIDDLNLLDIRLHYDMRQMYKKLENTVKSGEEMVKETQEDIAKINTDMKMFEIGESYYSGQFEDVRKVVQAYKIFGKKLKKVKDALEKKMEILTSDIDISSSPPMEILSDDEDTASPVMEKTSRDTKQRDAVTEDKGITFDTNMSFFNQGALFSRIVSRNENKEVKSLKDMTQPSQIKRQSPEHVDLKSPKHKKSKIESSEIPLKDSNTNVSLTLASETPKMKESPKEFNQTSSGVKVEVQEMKQRAKSPNQASSQECKTAAVPKTKQQPKTSNLKPAKLEVKTEDVKPEPKESISTKKLKKQGPKIEKEQPPLKEVIDLEIVSPLKVKSDTPRMGFKPIKLNLITPPVVKKKTEELKPNSSAEIKSKECQSKEFDLKSPQKVSVEETNLKPSDIKKIEFGKELATKEFEEEPSVKLETTIKKEEPKELCEESSSKMDIEIKTEDLLKVLSISNFDFSSVKIETPDKIGEVENAEISEKSVDDDALEKLEDNENKNTKDISIFKKTDEETLSKIFHEEETSSKIFHEEESSSKIFHEEEASSKILHEEETSSKIFLEEEASSKIFHEEEASSKILHEEENSSKILHEENSSKIFHEEENSSKIFHEEENSSKIFHEEENSSKIFHEEETLSKIFHKEEISEEVKIEEPLIPNIEPKCEKSPKALPVPSNIPLSTKQCLLKSMKVLSLLLSKKKTDSEKKETDSGNLRSMFPLSTLFPIYCHNLNAGKSKQHPCTIEESHVSTNQKSFGNNRCQTKSSKIDSNLEIMDMDLDSEEDN